MYDTWHSTIYALGGLLLNLSWGWFYSLGAHPGRGGCKITVTQSTRRLFIFKKLPNVNYSQK